MQRIRRALAELRSGEPLFLNDERDPSLILAVETLNANRLQMLNAFTEKPLRLLITSHRARSLGYSTKGTEPVALSLADTPNIEALAGLCCAGIAKEQIAPLTEVHLMDTAAIALARRARLLPCLISASVAPQYTAILAQQVIEGELLAVPRSLLHQITAQTIAKPERVSEASVPLSESEEARFVLYREPDGLGEHVAVIVGDPNKWPEAPAVRLHSACLTGDLFGSLRCDCGEQLRSGIAGIAEAGGGVLLYLDQEGRGIGLANKLRAYTLQDSGYDTIDADAELGFGDDERQYEGTAAILQDLGIKQLTLFTNNPAKINALEAAGITVKGREAVLGKLNHHNARYLNAKSDRAGHLLDDILTEDQPPR
ncbi:MAG: GTP cyclohydrolase II [Gammaproteobacteria bacterium]|nr:GTP cyclohydrolase II [Gammaproteobacteria bacterium]